MTTISTNAPGSAKEGESSRMSISQNSNPLGIKELSLNETRNCGGGNRSKCTHFAETYALLMRESSEGIKSSSGIHSVNKAFRVGEEEGVLSRKYGYGAINKFRPETEICIHGR